MGAATKRHCIYILNIEVVMDRNGLKNSRLLSARLDALRNASPDLAVGPRRVCRIDTNVAYQKDMTMPYIAVSTK